MFKKKNILVVGDIMLDKYSHGIVNRISPEAPVPIVDIKKTVFKPGGASNVAQLKLILKGKDIYLKDDVLAEVNKLYKKIPMPM